MTYEFNPLVIITFTAEHDHDHAENYHKVIDHKNPVFPAVLVRKIQDFEQDIKQDAQAG